LPIPTLINTFLAIGIKVLPKAKNGVVMILTLVSFVYLIDQGING